MGLAPGADAGAYPAHVLARNVEHWPLFDAMLLHPGDSRRYRQAHIERNEDARSGHATLSAPLDPDLLQALREFVFVAGPWVRRFPSGRALDDLAREQEYPPEHVEPAIEFFRRIREASLVRDDDARAFANKLLVHRERRDRENRDKSIR